MYKNQACQSVFNDGNKFAFLMLTDHRYVNERINCISSCQYI